MKKQLSLAIPKSKMQPPPKKSEIIDALTKIRVTQLDEESKKDVAERVRLEQEIKPQLISYAVANMSSFVTDFNQGYCNGEKKLYGIKVYIELDHKDLSVDLIAKLRKLHSLPERARNHCFSDVRKGIAMEVNGMLPHEARVKSLLEDTSSREALEKMLEAIS